MKKIKAGNNFDWKTDIPKYAIFVGVLQDSDHNCSHAISIVDKWIFDANEEKAIPLGKPGLDYCTCDGDNKSTFIKFNRGILLYYKGTKQGKISKMVL